MPSAPGTLLHFVSSPKCLNTFPPWRQLFHRPSLPQFPPGPLLASVTLQLGDGFALCLSLFFFLAFGVWLTFVPAPLVPPWGHYCSYKVSALNFLPVVLLLRHNVFCCFRPGSIFCRLIAIEVCFLWSGRA